MLTLNFIDTVVFICGGLVAIAIAFVLTCLLAATYNYGKLSLKNKFKLIFRNQ